jgi:hypothetical protein
MERNSWQSILKNRVMQIYAETKRRSPHLWNEAQQLPGMGEVATLDSIVIKTIKENLDKPNIIELATRAAENYILKDW